MRIICSFIVFGVFIFSSCGPKINTKKIEKLDNLVTSLEKRIEELDSFDEKKLKKLGEKIKEQNKELQKVIKDKNLTNKNLRLISEYGRIEKGFKKLPGKKTEFKRNIKKTIKQLEDLKYDYSEGVVDEKKFDDYFKEESKFAETYLNLSKTTTNVIPEYLDKFDKVHSEVGNMTDSLANIK